MAEELPKGKRRKFTGAGEPKGRTKAKVGDMIRMERRNQWGVPPHSRGDVVEVVRIKHGDHYQYTTYHYKVLFKTGTVWITPSHNWEVIMKYFAVS